MESKPSPLKYQVFVSHAGEDKKTIAIPLREMLSESRITAFVDERDIQPGGSAADEMTSAMENASVAVIVLSPEFVAKKWPMKELLFFLNSRKKAQAKGESLPVIIPVFYRLSVADMYHEPRLERLDAEGKCLYRTTRFFERMENGEPEANLENIRDALRSLHGIMGVVNEYQASNDESSKPSRLLLLKDICTVVLRVIAEHNGEAGAGEPEGGPSKPGTEEKFEQHFDKEPLEDAFFDFRSIDDDGNPLTFYGRIKHHILNRESELVHMLSNLFAIHGVGGVGKSTILKGLTRDIDFRESFPDGIYFISLGMDATHSTLFQELCRVLHDSGAVKTGEMLRTKTEERARRESDIDIVMTEAIREAIRDLTSRFHGKKSAFLVDDVWTTNISAQLFSELFRVSGAIGPESSMVFTTRERDIASDAPRENMFHLKPRDPKGEISRKILFCHADVAEKINVDPSSSIVEVLRICSGLPASLAAAGKGVKMQKVDMETQNGDAWSEYLTGLGNYRESLLQANVGSYGNLYVTYGASISLLEEARQERLAFNTPASFGEMHRRLCVLRRKDKVPANMLKHLWQLQSEAEAKAVGKLFVKMGLAESEYKTDGCKKVWYLGIHDSLHDFATAEARRHEGVARAHEVLLDGYSHSLPDAGRKEGGLREWWSDQLKDDGYIHENLCRHLKEAGRDAELGALAEKKQMRVRKLRRRFKSPAVRLQFPL